MNIFLWIIGGIFAIVLLIALIKLITSSTRVVSEEKRLVIYRIGRFHRISGPGPVTVIPILDEVKKTIEVRNHPLEVTVDGVFAYGVPNSLTLNLWCSFDLVKAAGKDREKLVNIAQMNEGERRQQVKVKMHEALIRQIAILQERMPLPATAPLMERVAALVPGGPRYNELLKGLKYDLEKTLPSIGVVLSPDHPIALTGRNIADEITEAIKRRRGREMDSEWLTNYADELRQRFPGISNTMLAQMLLSIEGIDIGNIQRLLTEQGEDFETEVEFELSEDGKAGTNVINKPQRSKPKRTPPRTQSPLTKNDLAVLKRISRREDEALSA